MTGNLPAGSVTISVGNPQNLAKSKDQKMRIEDFAEMFRKPLVTPEKFHQFVSASFSRKQQLKASAGWFIRCPIKGGIRNRTSVQPSQLITYDLDDVSHELMEAILSGKVLPDAAMVVHSTRSHTPENPRLRMTLFPLKKIKPEDYSRVSRIVGEAIDQRKEHIDPVSFRPAQMMFLPSVSRDMEKHYIFYVQGGDRLDTDQIIEEWEESNGTSLDIGNLPRWPSESKLRETADEAEDPLTKKGPVGDFCRAWSITELVQGKTDEDGVFHEGPLQNKYNIDDWDNGAAARMTYLGGHSTNGAVVYGDKFCYSHHGTDPASDQLCNAYDLVRLHLFGDKDKSLDEDAPMKDRPSVKEMAKWMGNDVFYREAAAESRYGAEDAFDEDDVDPYEDDDEDLMGEFEEPDDEAEDLLGMPVDTYSKHEKSSIAKRRRMQAKRPPKRWIAQLNLTDDGQIKNTIPNATAIIKNDPRFFRKIAFNEHKNEVALLDDIDPKNEVFKPIRVKNKTYGDRWQDSMTSLVQGIIELESGRGSKGGYDIRFADNTVHKAVELAARHNAFHPVKDFLDDCREEGQIDVEMLETFFIRHAGCPNNTYIREATRAMAIASVARVEEPGCKFDYAIIFEGKQGTGKSTLIRALYGDHFFGEVGHDISNPQKAAEAMNGRWALEFAELASMGKAEVNDLKQFITRQRDDVRLAYGRNVSELPRQTVFYGTTNDKSYLKDRTGNRRFWPFPTANTPINSFNVIAERADFWATAFHLYEQVRADTPDGDLPINLSPEAAAIVESYQTSRLVETAGTQWADQIDEFIHKNIPLREYLTKDLGQEIEEIEFNGLDVDKTIVQRIGIRASQLFTLVFDRNSKETRVADTPPLNVMLDELERNGWMICTGKSIKETAPGRHVRKRLGLPKTAHAVSCYVRPGATDEEISKGYRVIRIGPEADAESEDDVADDSLI